MTTKELLEIIILVIGGGGAAAAGGFSFATMRAHLAITELELKIKTEGQDFARKVQKNIDHNGVEIGIIKKDIRDIKHRINMSELENFPEENKPKRTGWTIEDA